VCSLNLWSVSEYSERLHCGYGHTKTRRICRTSITCRTAHVMLFRLLPATTCQSLDDAPTPTRLIMSEKDRRSQSWLYFGRPAPLGLGRGSAAGRNFLAPPYYSQRPLFVSLWALFHLCRWQWWKDSSGPCQFAD